ncbi:diguanylate cyclase/phosphodiesterase [Marinobacter daqiaonensis]|uniref:Diguanylate cyclase/phosphodiesterase n=1 Tax=Marinobacter daqiaonensis TaxID=650891 RepID=A0A1I6IGH7_9GAMM|nr:EAL domain-containing protein [Marinobacter daqiaonensis]SFR65793.1 diguanylate cyclase/phosphodiesterase [Marinobacter daqiaonensis]
MVPAGLGFRGRLLAAMLSLVAATAVVLGVVFLVYLLEDEKQRASDSLDVAARVTSEIMARRSELLTGNLQVLVDDFGFRSAIASNDQATMESALVNHAGRAGADIAVVLDNQGAQLIALGISGETLRQAVPGLLQSARNRGGADQIISAGGRALQMFAVPIRGAGLRAWLVAGFVLDDAFARQLADLTGTDVLFRIRQSQGQGLLAASRRPDRFHQLLDDLPETTTGERPVENERFFIRTMELGGEQASAVQAVLLIDREEALANYYNRATDLALILMLSIVLSGLVVLVTARALGQPVLQLARFATAIGEGKDAAEPSPPRTRELRTLQSALTTMQQRVRDREDRIRFNAFHDELTGLANRKALNEKLSPALEEAHPLLLVGVTLNRFRALNDTLGFQFGDQVLSMAADRLQRIVGHRALVLARTGGNEFMVLVEPMQGPLKELLLDIRDGLQATATIGETPISLHVAVAGLKLPEDAATLDQVRRRLSLTLKRAEHDPRSLAVYEPGGDETHLRELTLTQDLRRAIADNGLNVVYQPKILMASAEMIQVEALARWQHPEMGFISPEEFILLAEQTGQIGDLTRFILSQISQDLADLHRQGLEIGAAINLSALDLSNPTLTEEIREAFSRHSIPFSWLTFEITESAFMSDATSARATLDQLGTLGASLSVDDFGTGYSSLSQLRQLPVQELKIDKSFVLRLEQEPQDQLIVRSTIDMAHGLGLSVVAEGIENLDSWRLLQQWGCDKGQGFFMARPMPQQALAAWARDFRAGARELRPLMTGDMR